MNALDCMEYIENFASFIELELTPITFKPVLITLNRIWRTLQLRRGPKHYSNWRRNTASEQSALTFRRRAQKRKASLRWIDSLEG